VLPSQASPSIKEYLHKITEIDLVFEHLDLASNLQRYDGDPESNSTPRKYLQFVLDLSETGTLKSLVYKGFASEYQKKRHRTYSCSHRGYHWAQKLCAGGYLRSQPSLARLPLRYVPLTSACSFQIRPIGVMRRRKFQGRRNTHAKSEGLGRYLQAHKPNMHTRMGDRHQLFRISTKND